MSQKVKGLRQSINAIITIAVWTLLLCTILLSGSVLDRAQAQDYQTRKLIRNLLKIGYPLDREDVIALDKIGMRFDITNRIDVLNKILSDRESIHNRRRYDYFTRTEVICDALRLLDEHDLPVVHGLIDNFNQAQGWETREKALLAFMAAKRGIRYRDNTDYLLEVLPQYSRDLEKNDAIEASQAIIDIMNFLSYIAELFAYKSDEKILLALFAYASNAYGFPAEYLSHMFVNMFLYNPQVFVSQLAKQETPTTNTVTTALVFGMRNNQVREKVKAIMDQDLFSQEDDGYDVAITIMSKLKAQIEHVAKETPAITSGMPMGQDQ